MIHLMNYDFPDLE